MEYRNNDHCAANKARKVRSERTPTPELSEFKTLTQIFYFIIEIDQEGLTNEDTEKLIELVNHSYLPAENIIKIKRLVAQELIFRNVKSDSGVILSGEQDIKLTQVEDAALAKALKQSSEAIKQNRETRSYVTLMHQFLVDNRVNDIKITLTTK